MANIRPYECKRGRTRGRQWPRLQGMESECDFPVLNCALPLLAGNDLSPICGQPNTLPDAMLELLQGQIGLCCYKLQQPVPMRLQRRAALAAARPRADTPGLIMQFRPANR